MNYDWYKVFNKTEFEALDLVSKTYTLDMEGIGEKEVLVTKGVELGITYQDVFLPLNLNAVNPFEFEDHAIYIDANDDVFLGIAVEDEA
jgi:hypothetical protein